MTIRDLDRLAALIRQERQALLLQWRGLVRQLPSAKHLDVPTLNDHIPAMMEEIAAAFQMRSDESIPEAINVGVTPIHGLQRAEDGFDIAEVVAEYNILRGCIHDLADRNGLSLQGKPFHILNRVFDGAIGLAVETFATQRALDVQRRREEYLAFVVHDLRTPLHAISLASKVLELTHPAGGVNVETGQIMNSLRRNVLHLETLISKIIEENANLQTEIGIKVERRVFDLWPLVEALIHDLHPVAGTGSTQLINQIPDDLAVYADASLLRRVFQNLIANAIKYTPRGNVTIGARELDPKMGVECWVSDNGTGVSNEILDKAFEKGETDPENEGGTGLGLAIVKTFIEAHGGTIALESEVGVGSTLRFSLPNKMNASN